MNTRPTEFRTPSDLQAQAREERFRRLPTPNTSPAPVVDDSPVLTMFLQVFAGLVLWAVFGWGVIALIAGWLS